MSISSHRIPPRSRVFTAFSLIEVTLALGIIAVALIPLMALLPVGLTTQRDAASTTTLAQIHQTITADLQRAEFEQLVDETNLTARDLAIRSFDDQGGEVDLTGQAATVATGAPIYDVQTVLEYPAPMATGTNHAMVRAEIRVAFNPGRIDAAALFNSPDNYETTFAIIGKSSN